MKVKPRKFTGFGVVTRQGHFLWQYSRPKEADARDAYLGHNPEVEGHPDGHQIVNVHLTITPADPKNDT